MTVNLQLKSRQICGQQIILVPYRELHVPKYNGWMQDPELQYLTASEPLSLDQEFEMFKSWSSDTEKCTFIILDKVMFEKTNDEVTSMIGDVNVFIDSHDKAKAEIEVMIAEASHRKLGKGNEAVKLMMRFAVEMIGIKLFVAKIKDDNFNSQRMFLKLGFAEMSRSEIFKEIEYHLLVDDLLLEAIKMKTPIFNYLSLN